MTLPASSSAPPRRPPRGRLALRLAAGIGLGSLVILALAAWWHLSAQHASQEDLVHASADRIANFVRRATRDAMLRNDPDGVTRIAASIADQPTMERIRVFDKQGRIQMSTTPGEKGRVVDVAAEQCTVCHRADRPLERPERTDRMRVYARPTGGRVLAVIEPIPNEPDCSTAACHAHDPSQRVLGVLDVAVSLDAVDANLAASQRRQAIGVLATVLAMLGLAATFVWRDVLRPVRRLERAIAAAGRGDLSARAVVTSNDELGALTVSWNELAGELERARRELEAWNATLASRVEAATSELERAHQGMLQVERMASLGKLAAVVAHELNNPLAGIATYAKLLHRRLGRAQGGLPADAETERALELVETEAVRCGEIVRNLLTFSRQQGARMAEQDLQPFLERCVLLVRHQADLHEVSIALEVAPDLPKVVCDGSQVQQAALALCTNAIEAMPRGGRLELRVRHDLAANEVVLEVADDGAGIDPKDLPHVFEPFYTTKEQGKGVGLGLAVVYGIVTRHRGRIEVQSRPGAGTTFTIRLPVRQPDPGEAAAAPHPAGGTP